jgi:hypothetical protein
VYLFVALLSWFPGAELCLCCVDAVQVRGDITYNGEGFDSFQVARTCAYISQTDEHQAELTVRETFDFAARCLGVGHKQGEADDGLCGRLCKRSVVAVWNSGLMHLCPASSVTSSQPVAAHQQPGGNRYSRSLVVIARSGTIWHTFHPPGLLFRPQIYFLHISSCCTTPFCMQPPVTYARALQLPLPCRPSLQPMLMSCASVRRSWA